MQKAVVKDEYKAANSAAKWVHVLVDDSVVTKELWKAVCWAEQLAAYLVSILAAHLVE